MLTYISPSGVYKEDFMEMKKAHSRLFSRSIALVLSVLMCLGAFSMTAYAATTTKNLKDGDFTVSIDKKLYS